MNKIILSFAFSLLCVSCVYPVVNKEKHMLIDAYRKDLYNTSQIQLFSLSPQFEFKEDKITLSFFSYHKLSLEKAKWVIEESTKKLIEYLENNSNIICLSNNFNIKNINISIMFLKLNGDFVEDEYIAHIHLHKGTVNYSYYNTAINFFGESLRYPLVLPSCCSQVLRPDYDMNIL